MMKAIYPGTFDPITQGHLDSITRASQLVEHLIVAVSASSGAHKKAYFSHEQRIALARETLSHLENITVVGFTGLLVDFIKEHNSRALIRGIRSTIDFEYERQLADMVQHLLPGTETLFLPASNTHTFISSSLVKEVALLNGDLTHLVPVPVINAFRKIQHGA